MLELKNLSKTFSMKDSEVVAVSDVSLKVKKGSIFGVIGFSGAGKSTLVKLLNLLEKPDSGSILIDGKPIENLSEKELRLRRQKIAMVFQQFNLLWSMTVYDNIALPLKIAKVNKNEIDRRVNELLDLVGLKDKAKAYPAQLSGGQKQRCGIARALANHPDILLCDEATSALDPETTRSILFLLQEINQKTGVTIIMISHEMAAIKLICDEVAVMDSGKIIEVNNVKDLFLNPKEKVTKSFVQDFKDPSEYQKLLEQMHESFTNGYILELSFPSKQSRQPILSKIVIKHQLNLNIIHGQLVHTNDGTLGSLYVHVDTTMNYSELEKIFEDEDIIVKEV